MASQFFLQAVHYASRIQKIIDAGEIPLIVLLRGPLGAGKTTLVKEILSELEFDSRTVQSPTFLKLLEYRNSKGLLALHIDTYRMQEAGDLESLGLASYAEFHVCFVEWPDLFVEFLKQNPSIELLWGKFKIWEIEIDSKHQIMG